MGSTKRVVDELAEYSLVIIGISADNLPALLEKAQETIMANYPGFEEAIITRKSVVSTTWFCDVIAWEKSDSKWEVKNILQERNGEQ